MSTRHIVAETTLGELTLVAHQDLLTVQEGAATRRLAP